jgi:hypothetical protein
VYSVQLINSGNVHLHSVNLHPVTNSSTNGMNTTFPLDCGVTGALPRQFLVSGSFTCMRTIDFTTPVGGLFRTSGSYSSCSQSLKTCSTVRHTCVCCMHCKTRGWLLRFSAGHPCWQHDCQAHRLCHQPASACYRASSGRHDTHMREQEHT